MWHDRIVYYRDFAYNSRRLRMANGSIGDVPAATFAEYVDDPFFPSSNGVGARETSSLEEKENRKDALPKAACEKELAQNSRSSRCIALRPGLTHRLYSHQLHVRAKAKLQRDRLLSGPMIDIYVGEAKRHWSLHRNLLCHHSELLENELQGDGQGSKRKDKLELLEFDPAGFELLVKWLYQGKLDDVSDMADANQKYEYAVSCHKLYLLCGRLDMPQLKNVAMDQYRKGLNEAELVPDADEIDEIYRKSPSESPFRQLMTRIAARQIMDPGSERDVETYRQCFENNPDFAVDLVKAIRNGTGGMLFDDPTDPGNPCLYHDHEDGPNCHIKGKGRVKQARKTQATLQDPSSTKSTLSMNYDLPSHPPLLRPPKIPRQQLLRQVPPQDRISAGPLRRRLTGPATSTVGTSPEMAIASPPPNQDASKDREKWRKVTPPERKRPSLDQRRTQERTGTQLQHQALEEPLQNSENAHRQLHLNEGKGNKNDLDQAFVKDEMQQSSPRRGIWDWARAGTGRLTIIGRIPHPEWKASTTTRPQNGVTVAQREESASKTQDDFSIPSATATIPDDEERHSQLTTARMEGYGILHTNITSPSFAQTKGSSDELVAAASSTGTPESRISKDEHWTNGMGSTPSAVSKNSPPSTPDTPTPQQRKKNVSSSSDNTPTKVMSAGNHGDSMQNERKDSPVKLDNTPEQRKTTNKDITTSNISTKRKKEIASPDNIPKYTVALSPNILSATSSSS